MSDRDASPEPAEPRDTLPEPDKMLSWVCTLWLLNAAAGAAVAIREDLPGELIADVFNGRDASAEFFKRPGTALSPGLAHIAAQALFAVLSTRGGRAGRAAGIDGRLERAEMTEPHEAIYELDRDVGVLIEGDARAVAEILWAAAHGVVSLELAGHFTPEVATERCRTLCRAAMAPFMAGRESGRS